MGQLLNRQGFNVYAFDRRGSGLNQQSRGHLYNYFYLFDDIKIFLDLVKKDHPRSKIFLIGLCLGGKIATTFFLFHPDYVNGLILLSPSIENRLKFPLARKLAIVWCSLFAPQRKFSIPIEDRMFTDNPKYLQMIKDDPQRLKYVSARYFMEIFKMDLDLTHATRNIHVPLLVLLAGIDEIIDVEKVQKWFDKVSSSDKTIRVYKDNYHMLLFDESAPEIMQYIADWIQVRSSV